jgi:hypothetical protein
MVVDFGCRVSIHDVLEDGAPLIVDFASLIVNFN